MFFEVVNTKPGKVYHLSVDITPNAVTKIREGNKVVSEFSEKELLIDSQNEDGSRLTMLTWPLIGHQWKKEENTYSTDILAQSNKTCFYFSLINTEGHENENFYSAKYSNISITEK